MNHDDIDAMTLNILERETGTQFNHTAYFASSEIFTSLLGGHVDFAIANGNNALNADITDYLLVTESTDSEAAEPNA